MFRCFYIYVLPSLLFVIFLIKWILTLPAAANNNKNPQLPSPLRLPILGNLHQLGRYPHISLSSLAQRYGPLMMLRFGSMPVLVVSSADAAREIMKTHDLIFSNRPIFGAGEKLLYHGKDLSTAQYGEYWRQMRSISVLHLLSNKRVQSFKTVREEEIALFIDKIKESSFLVAFGRKYGGEDEGDKNFREVLEFFFLLGSFDVGTFIPWLSWINLVNGIHFKVDRVAKWFDNFLDKVIDEHTDDRKRSMRGGEGSSTVENDDKNKDFVDVLLGIQKDNDIAGFSLERDGIKGLILDMFAGGTDTTYTVLEWAMAELLRHPEVKKRVQNEGYDIAAGTVVFSNAWAIRRDPATWDAPDEFWPERFLNNPIDIKGHDFELIPFGASRRGCPGLSFAMVIIEVVLANLVYKFDWSLPGGATEEDLDMTQCIGLVAHRKVHLKAVATAIFC
ncbi:hypothetical protein CRYUN_Cryun13aG0022100 [Craigia yunnanensis]